MMLKLDYDNVVMIDNHITVRCIFLNTSLSEKIKMSFLQNSLLQVEGNELRKSEVKPEMRERLQASFALTVIVRPTLWIIGFIYST